MMHKIVITLLFGLFLFVAPVYAGNDFQYSKPIQTDNSPGYKYVVLDKEVYAHSNQLQDLRVFDETDAEVPYFLDSIRDATTSKEKEGFIQSELAPFAITQDRNDTLVIIEVNHLFAFHLELSTDDIFERNYGLYGINSESKRYLLEGTLSNSPLVPSLTNSKDMVWSDNSPVDQLQLVIHNRDNKPINLKSVKISYYINKLVLKDLGNTHYRLTYGNAATSSPRYDIMDYKTTIKKRSLTQAMLGTEVSIPPKTQLPENPTPNRLLFNLTSSALALLLIAGIGLSLRTKHLK
ncbi:MAG TPA: DUF3999 family protein [Desulfosporosinus sp.]|nr:DUF3999 family protein [Desulfosporosinus sp.]